MSDVLKRPATRALLRITSTPWAITAEALEQIYEIAARQTSESWEAVAAKMGKPLENTWTAEIRDGVAIVPVMGPIFRYANLMTSYSGATSVQDLATDLRAALENPAVRAILLNVNSPGGQVDGINEMAGMIRDARASKPVNAYIGGYGASAAYFLASQASEIVADPTAMVGSVGVVVGFTDRTAADEKSGIKRMEIVSSQSPKKRLDPTTDEGRASVQAMADDLAEEFIAMVAAGRGVAVEKVLADFGQGDSMMARRALTAGMIDRVGSFEGLLAEMAAPTSASIFLSGGKGGSMADVKTAEQWAAEIEAAKVEARAAGATEGRKTERARVSAILSLEEAKNRGGLAQTIALETDTDAEAAKKLLAAAPVQTEKANPLAGAMADVKNPAVGTTGGGDETDAKTLIEGVTAFLSRKAVK
jgi:signal peptide peptidase SppA